MRRLTQLPGVSLANLCTDLINLLPTFHINVHNFVTKTFRIVSKIQLTIFGSVCGVDMDHLRRLTQPPSVSLTAPGPDLTNMVSSFHINAHKFVTKSFTFFQFYFLYAFQNWTKSTTAPQPTHTTKLPSPISQTFKTLLTIVSLFENIKARVPSDITTNIFFAKKNVGS